MKRILCLVMLLLFTCSLFGCSAAGSVWNCTTAMPEDTAPQSDIDITTKICSETGTLTFQNRNDFDISVSLSHEGQPRLFEIKAGGVTVFHQAEKAVPYAVSLRADVPAGTEIQLFVYDGERAEIY